MVAGAKSREARGVSVIELVTVVLIVGILASVSVPLAAAGARYSVPLTARNVAVVLRLAQTTAQADDARVRFQVAGSHWSVLRTRDGVSDRIVSGDLGAISCATNYPDGWVEFDRRGYPLSVSSAPRAGSFTFSYGGLQSTVVLQLTGRVRVR